MSVSRWFRSPVICLITLVVHTTKKSVKVGTDTEHNNKNCSLRITLWKNKITIPARVNTTN